MEAAIEAPPSQGGTGDALRGVIRKVAAVTVAGLAGGLVGLGGGSRAAMRVLAVTSSDEVQGTLTDAEARVGEITAGGTIFLVAAGTLIGGVLGFAYLAVRRWLPERRGWRALAYGIGLMCVFAPLTVDPNNEDFAILTPTWLGPALFSVIFLVYGVITALMAEWLLVRFPQPRGLGVMLYLFPAAALALTGPTGIALVLVIVLLTLALAGRDAAWWASRRVDLVGRVLLLGLCAFGLSHLVRHVVDIV